MPPTLRFDVADAGRNARAEDRRKGQVFVAADQAVALMNGRDHAPIERRCACTALHALLLSPPDKVIIRLRAEFLRELLTSFDNHSGRAIL